MAAHTATLQTKASPEAVWRVWSDVPTWQQWNPDVKSADLDGPFASRTPGHMTTHRGGAHSIRLAAVQPGRAFELETAPAPLSQFVFRCEIQPEGSGSRISQSVTMRGPLGWLYSLLMGSQMARGFEPILRGLAERAEQSSTG